MRLLTFSNHVNDVFAEAKTNYDGIKNLMFDLALGNEIYDAQSKRIVSKAEAEEKLRAVTRKIFGLGENPSHRDIKRAIRDHSREYFDVIEETVDMVIETGFQNNEFFNTLVDRRNIVAGDEIQFNVAQHDNILSIAEVGNSHHDFMLQRLGGHKEFTIGTRKYGAAVGIDLNMYLLGREDFAKLVNAIATAFQYKIQNETYAAMLSAASKLPVQDGFVGTGTLGTATKDKFDEIIENVSIANGSAVIVGTKTALKKLNALSDVDWRDDQLKGDVSHSGRMGDYEGTLLMEIPQRFALNDVTKKLVDSTKLWILPANQSDKFIKMVDQGETEIDEITEKGEAAGRIDDIGKYEVQRSFGIGVVLGRYFGQWTIA